MSSVPNKMVRNEFEITEREWSYLAKMSGVVLPEVLGPGDQSRRGTGVKYLIVVRESGARRISDLRGLNERTLLHVSEVDGARQLMAEGIEPLLRHQDYPGTIFKKLPDGGSASLRVCGDVWVLLLLGSAAVDNIDMNGQVVSRHEEATHNAATMLVQSVLSRLRPGICRLGGFDRLVRSFKSSPGMFQVFQRNVGWLEFGYTSLSMSDPLAETQWQNYTQQSTAAHLAVVDKTTEGMLSATRLGLWPFNPKSIPNGLRRLDDRTIVVSEVDRPAVALILRGLVEGLNVTDICRRMIETDTPFARRAAASGRRRVGTMTTLISSDAEQKRLRRRVCKFVDALPDMAMGKYVLSLLQPRSLSHTYLGFRPVYRDGEARHQLIWDMPDMFVDDAGELIVDEETFLRAVHLAVVRRVERGRTPSLWLDELEGRAEVRARIAAGPRLGDHRDPELDAIARWARPDGSMIDVVASATHPRFEQIRDVILRAAAVSGPRPQRPNQGANGWMVRFPGWLNDEGQECWLGQAPWNENYVLYSRAPDPELDPVESLLRARSRVDWETGSRKQLGIVARQALHRSITDAIAAELDRGTGVLAQRFDIARAYATGADRAGVSTADAGAGTGAGAGAGAGADADGDGGGADVLGPLYEQLAAAEIEASTLVKGLLRLSAAINQDDDRPSPRQAAMIEAAEIEVDQAQGAVDDLRKAITIAESVHRSQDTEHESTVAKVADVELLMDMLVAVRTELHGSYRAATLWQQFLPDFTAWMQDGFLHWETHVLVHLPDGNDQLVGPIRGAVVTNGAEDQATLWPELVARHLCVHSLDPTPLYDGIGLRTHANAATASTPDSRLRTHAVRYLAPRIGLRAATAAMTCPLLELRTLFWDLAHPVSDPALRQSRLPDVTDEFLDLFAKTYDNNPKLRARRHHDVDVNRQPMVDVLIAAGGELTVSDLAARLFPDDTSKVGKDRVRSWYKDSIKAERKPVVERVCASGDTRRNARTIAFRAHKCPHCASGGNDAFVDLVLPLPEVPAGMLCSTCLRMPVPDSPTFPAIYRDLVPALKERPPGLRVPMETQGTD